MANMVNQWHVQNMLQHNACDSSNLSLRYVYDNVMNFSSSFVCNWSSSNGPSHDLHEHHVIPVGNRFIFKKL